MRAERRSGAVSEAEDGGAVRCGHQAGAAAAGVEAEVWRELGMRLGEAYQVADDIADVYSGEAEIGKPIGQDAALGRPNAALAMGMAGAMKHLEALAEAAAASIPACPGQAGLQALTLSEARRLLPKDMTLSAA